MLMLVLYTLACVALFVFRNKLGLFWSATIFFIATYLFLAVGIDPPAPSAVLNMYAALALCGMLLYVTSSEDALESVWTPFRQVMIDPKKKPILGALLVVIPTVVAWQSFNAAMPSSDAPPRIRSAHPSPPSTIQFQGPDDSEASTIDILKEGSPVAALKESDPDKYAAAVARGKSVYYENCYYCHGDTLAADGHYAAAVNPAPANFTDPGVIPMLQDTFLFWRIAKGGPGLPVEGTPWDSSMPAWEKYLSEDDIWSVIAFMSDYTGYSPRGKASHGDEGGH